MSGPAPINDAIHAALARGVADGVFPGGAAAVFHRSQLVHLSAAGDAERIPAQRPLTADTLFDLASVTKVVGTTSAVLRLVALGALRLDDTAAEHWPEFAAAGKGDVTVRQLLAHTSGLPAWRPLFVQLMALPETRALFAEERPAGKPLLDLCRRGKAALLARVAAEPLEAAPGSRALYCDLGFITLGHIVERVAREALEEFVAREVFAPLGLAPLGYRPLGRANEVQDIASTGVRRPREPAAGQESIVPAPDPSRPPCTRPGEVDDDNAYSMGGVAGHAGLFGDARSVAAFGHAVIEELAGAARIGPAALWEEFCTRHGPVDSTRALGWDTPSAEGSSAGHSIARSRAVGHLGFTGTSLWIDRDRQLAVALLTNRVHPSRANDRIRAFRPLFHDAVIEALGLTDANARRGSP